MKPPRADPARRILAACAWVASLATPLAAAAPGAFDPQATPLEPERAFALSVQALDGKTVEVRFAIADGYYLYREKLRFSVEPTGLTAAPRLPPGKVKEDPFFGKVETYRGAVAVRLALDKPEPGQKITVKAESQGCADAGICYPPQIQNVTLALPPLGGRPGPPVEAAPARKSWFN